MATPPTHELTFTQRSAEQIFRTIGFNTVRCFEDQPIIHGLTSLARYLIWTMGTCPIRLLHLAPQKLAVNLCCSRRNDSNRVPETVTIGQSSYEPEENVL